MPEFTHDKKHALIHSSNVSTFCLLQLQLSLNRQRKLINKLLATHPKPQNLPALESALDYTTDLAASIDILQESQLVHSLFLKSIPTHRPTKLKDPQPQP